MLTNVAPDAGAALEGASRSSHRRFGVRQVVRALALVAGVATFAHLVGRSHRADVFAAFERAGPWLLLALLPFLLGMTLDAVAWRTILVQLGQRAPRLSMLRIRVASEAYRLLLPTGAALTEMTQAVMLRDRHAVPMSSAAASVAIKKAFVIATDAAFATIGLLAADQLWRHGDGPADAALSFGTKAGLWAAVLLGAALGALALIALARGGLAGTLLRLLSTIPVARVRRWLAARAEAFATTDQSARAFFRAGWRPSARAALLLLGQWLSDALDTFVIARLLGVPVSFGAVVAFEVVTALLRSVLFVIPAGLGIQDLAQTFLVQAAGATDPVGTAAAFVITKRMKELFWAVTGLSFLTSRSASK